MRKEIGLPTRVREAENEKNGHVYFVTAEIAKTAQIDVSIANH